MSRLIFVLFAFLATFSIANVAASSQCGENEIWKSCGSPCPATCQNPNPICIEECVPRCQCKPGLVQHSNGTCISPKSC